MNNRRTHSWFEYMNEFQKVKSLIISDEAFLMMVGGELFLEHQANPHLVRMHE
ncbi:hypothetical protein [Vibrio mexicanus]|uniref:hypothetical protein n=1 Tax=Vibrio mexicanus TaxID=1004326 RepID=UPI0012FAD2A1|nr:hypothetical protein [Vibrio mexicanus]